MYFNFIYGVYILVSALGVTAFLGSECGLQNYQSCSHYTLVTTDTFQGFISAGENFDTKCSNFQVALECARKSDFLKGCKDDELLDFNMIDTLYRTICKYFKKDYTESSKCFQSSKFKDEVQSCLKHFYTAPNMVNAEHCYLLNNVVTCFDGLNAEETECADSVRFLASTVMRPYLHPIGRLYSCPGYEETTTTSTVQTTTTTTEISTVIDTVESESEPLKTERSREGNGAGSITQYHLYEFVVLTFCILCLL
ncbi:hypothetical protein Bpfe_007443 [Biomphalaria pfeifferi]|uniref:DUF19 domain-containing protein n=1 Tax=Biomphalaria pfeifferi TaxID=112525 RepID=A0AAD8C028_BIOPF|nr:hypothetical protein Bpfe_007443 [Biomphalaria pfeifferi]